MSIVLSGPRRVYVLLLFWQRVAACADCPRRLSGIEHAIGAVPADRTSPPCSALCRVVVALRVQRVLWKRFMGLTLLVLDPKPRT